MKRLISFVVFVLLCLAPIMAGGQGGDVELPEAGVESLDPNVPGWTVDNSPISFDWYLNFSWYRGVWGEDPVSEYVTDKTGVNINFIIPAGNEAEKLNTLIASQSLPDFITLGWWEAQVPELIAGGLVHPLNELAELYDPYWFNVANPQRVGWYTQEDGNIYSYPNASFTPSDYETIDISSNQSFLVRKDMWEAIGSPSMRTPEEFLAALEAARRRFPEINGQPLIPIGLHPFSDTGNYSLESYLQNFLAIPYEQNGVLYDRYADEDYKIWLNTFREANARGLLAQDVFLDRRPQIEEKIAQGRYFAMLYQHSDLADAQGIRYQLDPNSIYIAIDGPANRNLDDPRLAGQGLAGWTVTFISKAVRNPDRAIRFMSYLMSEEGQRDLYLGVEGLTWETRDGREQFIPEVAELLNTDRTAFDQQYGASVKYWMLMDNPLFSQWEGDPVTPYRELVEWSKPYTVSYAVYDNIAPPPSETELVVVGAKLVTLFGEKLPELLQAPTEAAFNQIWDEFQAERQELGLADLVAYNQERVNENKDKLGL